MQPPFPVRENVPLAELTTLGVGGPARFVANLADIAAATTALAWAEAQRLPLLVLGGGSNVLASDPGFDGLVVRLGEQRLEVTNRGHGQVTLFVAAGVSWDGLVERCVAEGWAGLECLSGIPGRAGAAPIQNIGAYGQEVGERLARVHVLDREKREGRVLAAADCGLDYRHSHFKDRWRSRYVVTGIELELAIGALAPPRYAELSARLAGETPTLAAVRAAVLELRRGKSMVYDAADPNHRSAGSFFVNPVVAPELADRASQVLGSDLPRYPAGGGRVKLSAAWLIERCGFTRGFRRGPVGLSSRHALALVNYGDATAADILACAAEIRRTVRERTGIVLVPEVDFVGFSQTVDELLG